MAKGNVLYAVFPRRTLSDEYSLEKAAFNYYDYGITDGKTICKSSRNDCSRRNCAYSLESACFV